MCSAVCLIRSAFVLSDENSNQLLHVAMVTMVEDYYAEATKLISLRKLTHAIQRFFKL